MTLAPGGTATTVLRIFADDDTPLGDYTVTVVRTSGQLFHSVAIKVTVFNEEGEGLVVRICCASRGVSVSLR